MAGLRRVSGLPRTALGIAWRSSRTIVFGASVGLGVFLLATLVIGRSEPPAWAPPFYPLYVLGGVVLGGYIGLLTALRRETTAIVSSLAGYIGTLVGRALDELALPERGIEPARLRRLADARVPTPAGGRAGRAVTNFAVGRAIEAAGLDVLRERLGSLAAEAEARGQPVVARDAIDAVAREGLGAAVASRLALGWTATRIVALGIATLLLVSLPLAVFLWG